MDAQQLNPGEVLPLARRIAGCPDPLALFGQLTEGGCQPDTLMLESADINTRNGERSVLMTRCGVRAECRERRVTFQALTASGRDALVYIARELDVACDGDSVSVDYPAPPSEAPEIERLLAPSPTDALRTMARCWQLRSRPVAQPLMCAGIFSYDFIESYESLPLNDHDPLDFPDFVFWLPEEVVIIDHNKTTNHRARVGLRR